MRRIGIVFIVFATMVMSVLIACRDDSKEIPVTGVSLSVSEFELKVGQDTVIKATVTPKKATDASVIWYSDNPRVASVDDGRVKALSCGKALITVETVDGEFTAFCVVTVVPIYIPVDSITLDRTECEMIIGQTDTLKANVKPDKATNKAVSWISSDTRVVSVSDGVITAVGLGNAVVTATVVDSGVKAECAITVVEPYVKVMPMQAERLPDMLNARADHILFVADSQLVVAGGHIREFATTRTAEYLANGEWHSVNMNYTHDMAFSVQFSDGRMMIGGGCDSNYGVGQSAHVEIYDPVNHSFSIASSMVQNRTLSHAVEMANGDVFVSGNWYLRDNKELYSAADSIFTSKGSVSENRSTPYVLRSSVDNAIVFGPTDNYGDANTLIVDRLNGSAFNVTLFNNWRPYGIPVNWRAADCAIADYSYLIMAKNDKGDPGVIKVDGESFSLLDTELPIPVVCDDNELTYSGQIFVRKENRAAYLPAYNDNANNPVYYILKVDYSVSPAHLTLFKTDVLDAYASIWSMTMLPDGRLVACGGIYNSNYTPYSTVWAFKPE